MLQIIMIAAGFIMTCSIYSKRGCHPIAAGIGKDAGVYRMDRIDRMSESEFLRQ
jgi:hypothetical protein